ncbi:hypothetical protein FSP39_010140 [Pinctada imbricata]|uniref:Protein-lysine N-methyltransferase FSP39_010140 n=1 Tax=Pinctada imbricata TaxID=66713 RepID=A0AA88Y3P3_PINIB|nr:hypothetical protein FSP39_010140 [Pinctada imbricata]
MSDSEDDDVPRLSAETMAALQDFYKEQAAEEEKLQQAKEGKVDMESVTLKEDWQLSQFWYDDKTATVLAKEALSLAGENGRIACISSPTAYKKLRQLKPNSCVAKCMEYDERFRIYGDDFVFYDYNAPTNFPVEWQNSFDVVIADPPFLNEDCLSKTAVTVRFLTKDKVILCTGAVMEDLAKRLLKVEKCSFLPKHANQLQNEFRCYINYKSENLNKS